jgi:hypothetical protein
MRRAPSSTVPRLRGDEADPAPGLPRCAAEDLAALEGSASSGRGALFWDVARRARRLACWCAWLCSWTVIAFARPASAHDLAIDQLVLWPSVAKGQLRGQLTFDPELTRDKDARPSPEHERRVLDFVSAELRLSLDGAPLAPTFEVRELWERGGAALGDLVVFSVPMPAASARLRVQPGPSFKALEVAVQRLDASGQVHTERSLLQPAEWSRDFALAGETGAAAADASARAAARESRASEIARFVRLGVEHIVPDGLDHMLFVAALVLGSLGRWRRLLTLVSTFTLAHSLTLALGLFQLVTLPARWVEPVIALSIALVGYENVLARRDAASDRRAHAVVFGFGLMHGLGFARALSDLELDRRDLVLGLCSFNVGVEFGQLAVVALVLLALVAFRFVSRDRVLGQVPRVASALIAVAGVFMVFDRPEHGASEPGLSHHVEPQQ